MLPFLTSIQTGNKSYNGHEELTREVQAYYTANRHTFGMIAALQEQIAVLQSSSAISGSAAPIQQRKGGRNQRRNFGPRECNICCNESLHYQSDCPQDTER